MIKKLGVMAVIAIFCVALCCGCSSKSQVPDLSGHWKEVNSDSGFEHYAYIKGKTITIYMSTDDGQTKELYWIGSFKAPTTDDSSYSWVSKKNPKTNDSIFGSLDSTKKFTYEDGQLTYEFVILGVSSTIKMEKEK